MKALAGGLARGASGPGTVVAIMAPNMPEFAVGLPRGRLGRGTVTTVNPTYTAAEVAHQLKDSGASLLITIPALLDDRAAGARGHAAWRRS